MRTCLDVGERDQHRAVDADEPGLGPVVGEPGQRHAEQVAALGGVQPGVVALRLDVRDVGAPHEAGHPAPLDRDLLVGALARPAAGLDHAAYRLGETLLAHGLEDVVDRPQLERVDRVLLVGGHEHDRGRLLEAREHLGELEAGEAGHLDVEEDRVDLDLLQDPQRLGRRVAGEHLADPAVATEVEGELVEGGPLVVDEEHLAGRSYLHPHT